jgi:hypothetical protein
MILESGDKDGLTRKKSDWATVRIRVIQAACRANGITDEKRKAYMLHRWGVDSLLLMSDDQLEECRRYAVSRPPPKWDIPKVEILGMHPMREKAFARWLDEKEAEARAGGEDFNRQEIRIKGVKHLREAFRALRPTGSMAWELPSGLCHQEDEDQYCTDAAAIGA